MSEAKKENYDAKITALKATIAAIVVFLIDTAIQYVQISDNSYLNMTVGAVFVGALVATKNWYKNYVKAK